MVLCTENCALLSRRCWIGVTRSRKIESDRSYQKNKERIQELKGLWKRKNCILQLTSILKRLTLIRLQAFTSRMIVHEVKVKTFKIFNSCPRFCVDLHFLFPFSFLPRAWMLPGIKPLRSILYVQRDVRFLSIDQIPGGGK